MRGQFKIGLVVVAALIAVVIGWGAISYNRLVTLHEKVPAAWSQVENVMQRRNDLIPNYVATVKGFAKQEQTVYGQISQALGNFTRAQTIPEKIAADNTISGLLSRLMTVSLTYPELRSSEHFMRLQDELAGTENRISVERRTFNEIVREYNTQVKSFPTNLLARAAGFVPSEAYFKAVEGAKTAPQVQF